MTVGAVGAGKLGGALLVLALVAEGCWGWELAVVRCEDDTAAAEAPDICVVEEAPALYYNQISFIEHKRPNRDVKDKRLMLCEYVLKLHMFRCTIYFQRLRIQLKYL